MSHCSPVAESVVPDGAERARMSDGANTASPAFALVDVAVVAVLRIVEQWRR